MRFRVLGSLEVEVDGAAVELGGASQRAVLAVLLMHANQPVATDRLVNESWGDTAPASATKTAQVYVSRLRRALGNDTLATTSGGEVGLDALLERRQAQLLETSDLGLQRRLVAQVGIRRTAPEGEALAQ